ncbi:hypothetical protein DPMN_123162 [Dreissena polymorpha]|uniref:Uncharacterized protein n=1 Tax=Dreissena polymorpha TaxID=45954 RepID=A0A9D4GT72_DREPO|nr:hypothetical protein DPMN_123162 [Dreissena polymorpha]
MPSGGVQKLGKGGLEQEKSCINKAIPVPFKRDYVFFISINWFTRSYFPFFIGVNEVIMNCINNSSLRRLSKHKWGTE